jgi:predicted RND superfamily exporter protein
MVMVLKEWEMGASESIAMVIIIGFSVDYVVHLAAHYVHSNEK